ncbi:MAG: hypothetical protein QXH91_09340, partial [Candidatus Bathyarchaeia archaeon]
MIGELNLVKASTLLIDKVEPIGDTTPEGIFFSDFLITEMQTRLSYVGPLIGYIAAQQTAKNNRLKINPEFTESLRAHLTNNLEKIDGFPSLYEQAFEHTLIYNGYAWFEPYKEMLWRLVGEGLAVKATNTRYLAGVPILVGPGADLLGDPSFYDAIWGHDYCWFILRGIDPNAPWDFSSIQISSQDQRYFAGSEFLNLYVDFEHYRFQPSSQWDQLIQAMDPFLESRQMTPLNRNQPGLQLISWAVYDNSRNGWADLDIIHPSPSHGTYAFVGQYMRNPFKDEYVYGGAAARMFCEVEPSLLSGRWAWKYGTNERETPSTSLGKTLQWSAPTRSYAQRIEEGEERLVSLGERTSVVSSAAAKSFGKLGQLPPYVSGVVLPVFEQVRLIPAVLVMENAYDRNYYFFRFVTEYFGHPEYPHVPDEVKQKYWYYIRAIEIFLDPDSTFRKGWERFLTWREEYMQGPDMISGTDDDPRDPCLPPIRRGGGSGGSPPGGPSLIH